MSAAKADFESLWADARVRYAEVSGKDLKELPMPQTTEDLINKVEDQNGQYKHFREKQGTLFTVLRAAVKPIELVGNLAAGAASSVFPPSTMCFGAVMYLINAAHGVSSSLDAIAELFGVLQDFTVRLKVYNREDLSLELRGKLTDILVTVIEIFARSTKVIKDGLLNRLKSFGKNVLLGNDQQMQSLVGRLDKLTRSESLLVSAETLVETKRTARGVDAVQTSVNENTVKLSHLAISTNEMSAGVGQILNVLEESKAQAKVEKDVKHMETVKKVLNPSILSQDRADEIKREHVPGSGDWIRSEQVLQDWISSQTPILWISGNPGSGKSFLAYNIVSYLQELHQDDSGHAAHTSVGYFFFRDNKDQSRSFEQALRDISYQISLTDPAYAKYVANLSHSDPHVASIRSAWQKLFVDFFIEGDMVESSAFIVLDGIDESYADNRATFFELLNDLRVAGQESRLHVAMLGRPEIIQEIDNELGDEVPTVQVDRIKNGPDIARYVELSISKSRVLNRVSASLKELIVRTLTLKAGGMFMWVKLIIAELGKKSRESAIKEALNTAPKGLTQMLRHVLEGFSRALSDDEAADLNEMLCWVTLAKRPLALGELDAVFRLKSPEGEGILYLEGKLRKQFASFFILTRDDNLTTADLQAHRKRLDDDEDTEAGADLADEGLEDVENETDFDSNPSTTTLSVAHASISDYFRDPKQGKVIAPDGDHPAVGVNFQEAQLSIAKTCVDLLVDDSLLTRMKDAVSLRPYAANYWKEHLDELNQKAVNDEDKVTIGRSIARMLQEESLLPHWTWARNYLFYTPETAKDLLNWLTAEVVLEGVPHDAATWIKAVVSNPVELFEPSMKCQAERWFVPVGVEYIATACATIIFSYNSRKAGEVVDKLPLMSVERIRSTAEWAGLQQTADWHRRLGRVLRDFQWFDAGLEEFNMALQLDPGLWLAKAGISQLYLQQGKYEDALHAGEATLKLANEDTKTEAVAKNQMLAAVYKRMGECQEKLSEKYEDDDNGEARIQELQGALESYRKAFSLWTNDYECASNYIHILYVLADPAGEFRVSGARAAALLPPKRQCFEQVMELLRTMDNTHKDETTNLVRYLHDYHYDDDSDIVMIALSARELHELEWVQERYRAAIAFANKSKKYVISACLAVCLARLYGHYGNDDERAARIWETVGTESVTSTALASDIGYARTESLNRLGQYCIRKAIDDELEAEYYINKMERIAAKRRYGARMGTEDSVPPNEIALYLAAWYHKVGRNEEARQAVKAHMQDALAILSDDDPSNDSEGYFNLASALLAIGDESTAISVFHAIRLYKDGVAVIESPESDDAQKSDANDESESSNESDGGSETSKGRLNDSDGDGSGNDSAEDEEDEGDAWMCDGICGNDFDDCDGMIVCRYCQLGFCELCHKLLMNGELPINICGSKHSFLTVPKLLPNQTFKEGELLMDGNSVPADKWKTDLKRQYDL